MYVIHCTSVKSGLNEKKDDSKPQKFSTRINLSNLCFIASSTGKKVYCKNLNCSKCFLSVLKCI